MEETKKIIVKDFSDDFMHRISASLDLIHTYWYVIDSDPIRIKYINLELHNIFKRIHGKLKKNKYTAYIKEQWTYHKFILGLTPVKRETKMNPATQELYLATTKTKDWPKYKSAIEMREIKLYYCLELIGIMGKEKKEEKKLR